MTNRKAILVDEPEVGNQEAIAQLKSLAGSGELEVTVLVAPGDVPSVPYSTYLDLGEMFLEERRRRADEIVENLKKCNINASAKVRVGVRSLEIIHEVIEAGADYVVKVSEESFLRNSRLGSTDLHLLRKCPCPVWLTRPRDRSPYRRVFAAVDPSDLRADRGPGLDARILEWASEIARADNAELITLHAWELLGESLLLYGRGRIPPSEVQRLVEETRAARERQLNKLLETQNLKGVKHTLQIEKGRPAEVLPTAVERGRADLLVMGTVVRTGIRGFITGSTAEEVIPQLRCAILAVKPDDFVSPVERC